MPKHDIPIDADPSDHDLLIRIDERLLNVDLSLANHLRHHWRVTVLVLTIALGAVVAAVVQAF